MTPRACKHCQRDFYRSGRPEQRFCSIECHRADRYGSRPTSRRCEHCLDTFELGRRKSKRFCSARCVALWRERLARLRRMHLPPPPPRVRRKPGRIEWSISGMHRGRGMAPTPKKQWYAPRDGTGWARLLWRSGFRE
jgi:hypothetical protein